MEEFESFLEYEEGLEQSRLEPLTYPLWQFLVLLVAVFCAMLLASIFTCVANTECRQSVPTVHVLLTSKISGPFMVMGLSAGIYVFLMISVALYTKRRNKVILAATITVNASIGMILVVFPFTGWDDNWAVLVFIVAFFFWMFTATFSFRDTYKKRALRRVQIGLIVVYLLCAIVYTVLKFVPNTNIGLLVTEIVCGTSIIAHLAICVAMAWSVTISSSTQ